MLFICFNPKTKRNLSSGLARAITFNLLTVCLNASESFNTISSPLSVFVLVNPPQATLKISPSKATGESNPVLIGLLFFSTSSLYCLASFLASGTWSALIIPTSLEIERAVLILSPVTILTVIPALPHAAIAPGTSGLLLSRIPIMNPNIKSFANSWKNGKSFSGYFSSDALISSSCKVLYPNTRVRIDLSAYSCWVLKSKSLFSSNPSISPFSPWNWVMNSPILSGAPLA